MATIYVRKSGNDSNSGATEVLAKLTIASAITASANDDMIDIGVGTWAENISARRHYKGAGMYLTTISAVTSNWSTIMTFTNIKVVSTSGASHSGATLTFTDSIYDFSATTAASYVFQSCTVTTSRSILIGNGLKSYAFYNGTITISRSVIYNFVANNGPLFLYQTGVYRVSNSIVYNVAPLTVINTGAAIALEEYNCWYSGGAIGSKPGGAFNANSLDDVDPLFVSAGTDFRLTDSSPCIGKGHV